MELKDELIKLKCYINSNNEEDAKRQIDLIRKHFTSEEDKMKIDKFISSELKALTEHADSFVKDIEIKIQLIEISKMVSMSYIAQNYFNKTRQWLYQKINGNIINGKKATFTQDEIKTLNYALQDMSKKISSIAIS